MRTNHLPPLTACPQCHNYDRTTACRFCGISKLKGKPNFCSVKALTAVPAENGAVRVRFSAKLHDRMLAIDAVIAPADPAVGLIYPYPLSMQATDPQGLIVDLSHPEARYLASTVSGQLF